MDTVSISLTSFVYTKNYYKKVIELVLDVLFPLLMDFIYSCGPKLFGVDGLDAMRFLFDFVSRFN